MKLTFVVPVYNECHTLEALAAGIRQYAAPNDFRIVFVDDGSTDGSTEALDALYKTDDAVDVLRFPHNRGKSAALAAGFRHAQGDIVITMDADLQDDPAEIPSFLAKLEEGFDLVCGWKRTRHDPWHKTIPSRFYNAGIARLFRLNLHDVNCGFKAMRQEVARAIPMYGELHRLVPVLAANEGFRVTEIPVQHHPRRHGVSKYGFERFLRGAADVATVLFLSRYGRSPGHFFFASGLALLALAVVFKGMGLLSWLLLHSDFLGLAFLLGAVWAGTCGLVLPVIGLVTELLVREFRRDADPMAGVVLLTRAGSAEAVSAEQEKY